MPKFKPRELAAEAARVNREQLAALGGAVRAARLRRHKTQQQLADDAGISRTALGDIERGLGGSHTLDAVQRVVLAAGTKLVIQVPRDPLEAPADAGHLAIQELVLRLARTSGNQRFFELATRPAEPWRSADVGLRVDRHRSLVLCECWNTIGDIGAAARSTTRKVAEAEQLAVVLADQSYRIASCWVVRATGRNSELVRRYPEVFAARFPGSSVAWVAALTKGAEPPAQPGLVWCDLHATRLFPWRRR